MSKKKPATASKTEKPASSEVDLFWQSPTYIMGVGMVSGLADPDHVYAFDKKTAEIPGFRRAKWLSVEPRKVTKQKKQIEG